MSDLTAREQDARATLHEQFAAFPAERRHLLELSQSLGMSYGEVLERSDLRPSDIFGLVMDEPSISDPLTSCCQYRAELRALGFWRVRQLQPLIDVLYDPESIAKIKESFDKLHDFIALLRAEATADALSVGWEELNKYGAAFLFGGLGALSSTHPMQLTFRPTVSLRLGMLFSPLPWDVVSRAASWRPMFAEFKQHCPDLASDAEFRAEAIRRASCILDGKPTDPG